MVLAQSLLVSFISGGTPFWKELKPSSPPQNGRKLKNTCDYHSPASAGHCLSSHCSGLAGQRKAPRDDLRYALILTIVGRRPSIHWIVPTLSALPFGIGFLLIFMGELNYLVDAYEIYAASAMGAASCARSIFGVILPFAARPMYTKYAPPLVADHSCTKADVFPDVL